MKNGQLLELVAPYDHLALECDGMTRLLSTTLRENDIPHRVYQGQLLYLPTQEDATPHLWIELETDQGTHILDFRALLWHRKKPKGTVPHGLFQAQHYPDVQYHAAYELQAAPLDATTVACLLEQRYGLFIPCGYRTRGASDYLASWMQHEKTVLVETRYTPFAYTTPRLPNGARWCRYGVQGLEQTYGDRYHYFSTKTQIRKTTSGTKQDMLNWLGNVNYKVAGAPIELVNEGMGLSKLHMLLSLGWNVIALCGCPDERYEIEADEDRYSGCHLRYIANRLEESMPGLPILLQSDHLLP